MIPTQTASEQRNLDSVRINTMVLQQLPSQPVIHPDNYWRPSPLPHSSPANLKAFFPVMSALVNDGDQYFSMCSITGSMQIKWSTPGERSGLYLVSIMSRIRAKFLPISDPSPQTNPRKGVWSALSTRLKIG
jgi:hypothetical protein